LLKFYFDKLKKHANLKQAKSARVKTRAPANREVTVYHLGVDARDFMF
jgi:hypothetical protein